ncbi:MAG: hypothetical protein GC172_06770 [Phycisphaera sp.]|nr:hypothetical protein [Phycisphaera sp.]
MKVEPVRGPKFSALVRKLGASSLPSVPQLAGHEPEDPLGILLGSFLLWESTPALAAEALARLSRIVVDANELRVMLEGEVVDAIGEKYPFVEERAARLRSTLNDIFRRQHRTSLDHLRNASRKDQRSYLEGLAEIPPFVAGRTMFVAFELPAPIVDDTAVELLFREGIVEPTATTEEVVAWIGRNHRMEELPKVHAALSALSQAAWDGAGRGGVKIRSAYLARHAGFRAAAEAAVRRVEEERLERERAAARVVEERRLAEIAREEERLREKRAAEEARIKAKADREAARIAAIEAREKARIAREAEQAKRAAERAKEAERARKLAEREQAKREAKRLRDAARAATQAEVKRKRDAERAKREARQRAERERREAAAARKRDAKLKAAAKREAQREAAAKKAALKRAAMEKASAKKAAAKKAAAKKASAKQATARRAAVKKSAKSASPPKSTARPKSKPTLKSKSKPAPRSKPTPKPRPRPSSSSSSSKGARPVAKARRGR